MEKRWRVGLYVSEALDSVEIEVDDDKVECLWVTCLLDKGKAVGVVYLDFSKGFDTISHDLLLEKLQPMAWTGALLAG
ncbi:hypothetical protein TURU_093486 [Turdus rufiventris]|nr:hypothetical protein TURU_093486 [Turdus rufiventris]